MKCSGEIRRWINLGRKLYGKKNGVIGGWWWDQPTMEIWFAKNKRLNRRKKAKEEIRKAIVDGNT